MQNLWGGRKTYMEYGNGFFGGFGLAFSIISYRVVLRRINMGVKSGSLRLKLIRIHLYRRCSFH